MEVLDAIRSRRTISEMHPTPIPDRLIDKILDAAIWAPSPSLSEPWRFTVLGPKVREAVARALSDQTDAFQQAVAAFDSAAARPGLRFESVGAMVAVSCAASRESNDRVKRDNFAAICAAIQNMQLAAWAEGVGACVVDDHASRSAKVQTLLGLSQRGEELVGMIALGYPASVPEKMNRRSAQVYTRWLS